MNRIREWRQKRGFSLQQLAEGCGTTRAQVDKLERGERRLTVDWMIRLAKPLDCLPADLLPGQQNSPAIAEQGRLVPVRSAARGGAEQEMFLEDGPIDYRPCPSFMAHVRDAYAIYVVGESMTPMYRPGQLLYINPHKPLTPGRGVVITKNGGAVMIKELVRVSNLGLVLREYQPKLREFTVKLADVAEAHSVVGAEEPGN